MPDDQPSLFEEKQVRRGDEHAFVQTAPAEPAENSAAGSPAQSTPEEAKGGDTDGTDAQLDALANTVHTMTGRCFEYLHLLQCMLGGKALTGRAADTLGEKILYDLTDMEAARWLGWERSTINGRRNQLQGGSGALPGTKAHPLVVKSTREYVEGGRRTCLVTGNSATAWQASLDLFYSADVDARCQSCGMPIRWVRTPKGRRMPLDYPMHAALADRTLVTKDGRVVQDGSAPGWLSHFSTCPNANKHRKR